MKDEIQTTEEAELLELGVVSEDTHGFYWGHNWDGGAGWRLM